MKAYIKQALFILAVVGMSKYINGKFPTNPLDQFIAK